MSGFSHPKPGMHVERFCANDADSDPHMNGACDAMEVCEVAQTAEHALVAPSCALIWDSYMHNCMRQFV